MKTRWAPSIAAFFWAHIPVINGYNIRQRLGRGWQGEVYRVREEFSQLQRVLKIFDEGLPIAAELCSKVVYEGVREDGVSS